MIEQSTASEQQLAHTLRRKLLVQIATVDLPSFLVVEIEQVLFWLNYYKISNLDDHKTEFLDFLKSLESTYQKTIIHLLRKKEIAAPGNESKEFGTAYLYKHGYSLTLSAKERLKLKSTFAVMCTLQMKEYVYRKRGAGMVKAKATAKKA